MTNFKDMRPITHPAFFVAEKEVYLFFKDENDKVYFLRRSPKESVGLFDIGDVIDADEALPIEIDEKAVSLYKNLI